MENIQFNISEERLKHLLSLEKDYKEITENLEKAKREEVQKIEVKYYTEINKRSENFQERIKKLEEQYLEKANIMLKEYENRKEAVQNSINTKVEERLKNLPRIIRWWYEI